MVQTVGQVPGMPERHFLGLLDLWAEESPWSLAMFLLLLDEECSLSRVKLRTLPSMAPGQPITAQCSPTELFGLVITPEGLALPVMQQLSLVELEPL